MNILRTLGISAVALMLIAIAVPAEAVNVENGLNENQRDRIIEVLEAFDVDEETIETVRAALNGEEVVVDEDEEEVLTFACSTSSEADTIEVTYFENDDDEDSVTVNFDGEEYTLVEVESETGDRYEDNATTSVVYWEEDDKATLEIDDVTVADQCQLQEDDDEDDGERERGKKELPEQASARAHQVQECLQIGRMMRNGAAGDDVEDLQEFLKAEGDFDYPEITGYFGQITEEAVKRFQKREGIVSSGSPEETGYGQVGPKTRAAIYQSTCLNVTAPGQQEGGDDDDIATSDAFTTDDDDNEEGDDDDEEEADEEEEDDEGGDENDDDTGTTTDATGDDNDDDTATSTNEE